MSWFTGILVYCMVFMVVLLTVLPWGVRPTENPEAGHEPGAPEKPLLLKKFIATAIIALLVWGVIYVIIDQGWISFRNDAQRSGSLRDTDPTFFVEGLLDFNVVAGQEAVSSRVFQA